MSYELYSWHAPDGSWNFCLLHSPSGRYIQGEEVFTKRLLLGGVSELNRKISKLPVGATIYWLDRILPVTDRKAKESQSLSYPPENVIEQIRRYAEARHVDVQMLRKNRGQ